MNIFDMADKNSDSLKYRHDLLRKKYEEHNDLDILDEFTRLVKAKWTISINMDLLAIYDFLVSGRCKNVYEVKKELAEELEKHDKLEIPIEEALKGHLKSHYKPRTAFDRTSKKGEKFKYGALNIGGLGAYEYGECCVVFKRERVEKYPSLAFIKEDSLGYVDGDIVDIKRLSQDIANRECVHFLTALKHKGNIELTPDHKWSSMVCCAEDYIEVITADDILNTHIGAVRMSKEYYKSYFDSLRKYYASELSDDSKKYELAVFRNMLKLLDELGIEREVLNENGD